MKDKKRRWTTKAVLTTALAGAFAVFLGTYIVPDFVPLVASSFRWARSIIVRKRA